MVTKKDDAIEAQQVVIGVGIIVCEAFYPSLNPWEWATPTPLLCD